MKSGMTSMRLHLSVAMLIVALNLVLHTGGVAAQAKPQPDPPVWYWLGTQNAAAPVKVAHPADYWLTLREDHAAIRADCNRGTGPYELKGAQISFQPMTLTRKLCVQGSRGAYYATQLQSAQKLKEQDGALLVDLKAGEGTMLFSQNPKARLTFFRCSDGTVFTAIFVHDQVQVWIGADYYKLTGEKTPSGRRYANGQVIFETQGALGTLRKGDKVLAHDCQRPSDE
jgi:heat shock protein HslJ